MMLKLRNLNAPLVVAAFLSCVTATVVSSYADSGSIYRMLASDNEGQLYAVDFGELGFESILSLRRDTLLHYPTRLGALQFDCRIHGSQVKLLAANDDLFLCVMTDCRPGGQIWVNRGGDSFERVAEFATGRLGNSFSLDPYGRIVVFVRTDRPNVPGIFAWRMLSYDDTGLVDSSEIVIAPLDSGQPLISIYANWFLPLADGRLLGYFTHGSRIWYWVVDPDSGAVTQSVDTSMVDLAMGIIELEDFALEAQPPSSLPILKNTVDGAVLAVRGEIAGDSAGERRPVIFLLRCDGAGRWLASQSNSPSRPHRVTKIDDPAWLIVQRTGHTFNEYLVIAIDSLGNHSLLPVGY